MLQIIFSSVQFSRWVMSDSLQPHESQHARPPCPSPAPGVPSDSRPSNWWCHPAISSSVVPFSSWPQSLPASESFPMSQLFTWGGQSTGALASFLPKNTQDWFPSEWTGWISLQSKGLSILICCKWVRFLGTPKFLSWVILEAKGEMNLDEIHWVGGACWKFECLLSLSVWITVTHALYTWWIK